MDGREFERLNEANNILGVMEHDVARILNGTPHAAPTYNAAQDEWEPPLATDRPFTIYGSRYRSLHHALDVLQAFVDKEKEAQ